MTSLTTTTNRSGVVKLWLLNLLGNAAAIAVAYCWLLIPDAHVWQVGASALIAIAVVFLVAWMRAGTIAHFRLAEFRDQSDIWPAFRRGLRNLIPVMVLAAVAFGMVWCLWSLREYTPQFGVWLRQKLNGGPSPRNITRYANWLLVFLVCIVLPAFWLPIANTVAALGLRSTRAVRALRVLKRCTYWLWLVIFIVICGYIPYRLVWWIPSLDTLRAQSWSMGLRFLTAYVICVTGWIGLVWMVGVFAEREDGRAR